MNTTEQLTQALLSLASKRQRPRCSDPETHPLWTSEDRDERAQAATWCAGCPVLGPCAAAAEQHDEKFGVWGGVDRTPRPGRKHGRAMRRDGDQ